MKIPHLFILIFYIVLSSLLSLKLELNTLWSVILFMGLPSAHLSFLLPKSIFKSLAFSFLVSTPLIFIVDMVAVTSDVWFVESIFNLRIFSVTPIEELLWVISSFYFTIMFYEYFLDTQQDQVFWNKKLKVLVVILYILLALFLLFFYLKPDFLNIPFAYFWIGLLLVLLPVVFELSRKPKLAGKFFLTASFFFVHTFVYEITALRLGWWKFPSNEFIGHVYILGVSFPIEELFFWFMLASLATLSYYEFFADDDK